MLERLRLLVPGGGASPGLIVGGGASVAAVDVAVAAAAAAEVESSDWCGGFAQDAAPVTAWMLGGCSHLLPINQ